MKKVLIISGPANSGKTTLAQTLMNTFAGNGPIAWINETPKPGPVYLDQIPTMIVVDGLAGTPEEVKDFAENSKFKYRSGFMLTGQNVTGAPLIIVTQTDVPAGNYQLIKMGSNGEG